MRFSTFLRLGRVSNLATVWTNALAGAVLATASLPALGAASAPAAGELSVAIVLLVGSCLSLFYVGGMWLNDAFDAEIDARERARRPIPSGEVTRATVFSGGALMLAAGSAIAFLLGPAVGIVALALGTAILLYDWLHKRTVFSPVIMGAARFLCYTVAAVAVGQLGPAAAAGALGLFFWVVGLTYAAKQEAYDRLERTWPLAVLLVPIVLAGWFAWGDPTGLIMVGALIAVTFLAVRRLLRRHKGDVPRAVVTMIAGMSLYDAALIASAGAPTLALLAAAGFLATLALQRLAPGT